MSPSLQLSGSAARAVMLAAQGLLARPPQPVTKARVLEAIRRMGALQIDTINVVARSPYLVLWSRLGMYQPHWLDELLAEGQLFEYWSHAACFLPIEDYPLYRREMLEGHPRARAWLDEHAETADRVLARVRQGGEVRSAHFERTEGRSSGWWDWKPEKQALECLYSTGTLMIARRDPNFHRVYDLQERVLPEWDDVQTPSRELSRRELALKAIRALGVTTARWVPDYFKMRAQGIASLLGGLTQEGHLVRVTVDGWDAAGYVHRDNVHLLDAALNGELRPRLTTLLSPFDPLVWDRTRLLETFGFAYRIETYTPAARRLYGYFSLPILHQGSLVGRLDPKAHRKDRTLEVRALHLESNVEVTESLITGLREALHDFAAWQGLQHMAVRESTPPDLALALSS